MYYERKIKYFEYRKEGNVLRRSGYLKVEVRDQLCNLEIHIIGLDAACTYSRPVYIISKDRREKICDLVIENGGGNIRLRLPRDNVKNGISYEMIHRLEIPIASEEELYCYVSDFVPDMPAEPEEENAVPVMQMSIEENMSVETVQSMPEEKWQQLWSIYPHMQPFQDGREYLRIGPEDFVIFHNQYYKLVHNSFLLHGFYNYQHLILTRMERRGESLFYVGVPGNYYDREKQAAVMYGFESFECQEEPAKPGDYGYYMMRVDL